MALAVAEISTGFGGPFLGLIGLPVSMSKTAFLTRVLRTGLTGFLAMTFAVWTTALPFGLPFAFLTSAFAPQALARPAGFGGPLFTVLFKIIFLLFLRFARGGQCCHGVAAFLCLAVP